MTIVKISNRRVVNMQNMFQNLIRGTMDSNQTPGTVPKARMNPRCTTTHVVMAQKPMQTERNPLPERRRLEFGEDAAQEDEQSPDYQIRNRSIWNQGMKAKVSVSMKRKKFRNL